MKKHHVDIMISEADVRSRIAELGAEITHFYQQKAIDKLIVVGLLRGSFMFMADLVRELKLPVELWDERLSTVAAERSLLEADLSRAKRKKVIDKMAAMYILQGYLDSKPKK